MQAVKNAQSFAQPLISFILPAYNVAPYLTRCVESLQRQAISQEIIIINDGSTDNTLDIALQLAQQDRAISVISCANQGVAHARNLGLNLARGEFVQFVDPDNHLPDNAYLAETITLAKAEGVDVIKGCFTLAYHASHHQAAEPPKVCAPVNALAPDSATILPLQRFFTKMYPDHWFIQIGCFVIRREFLRQNQLNFFAPLRIGEDVLFNTELMLCEGWLLEVPHIVLNYYSKRPESLTSSKITATRLLDEFRATRKMESHFAQITDVKVQKTLGMALYFHAKIIATLLAKASTDVQHALSDFPIHAFVEKYKPFAQRED